MHPLLKVSGLVNNNGVAGEGNPIGVDACDGLVLEDVETEVKGGLEVLFVEVLADED